MDPTLQTVVNIAVGLLAAAVGYLLKELGRARMEASEARVHIAAVQATLGTLHQIREDGFRRLALLEATVTEKLPRDLQLALGRIEQKLQEVDVRVARIEVVVVPKDQGGK